MEQSLTTLRKGTLAGLLGLGLLQALSFVALLLKARLLTQAQFGTLALATSLVLFFSVLASGLSSTLLRYGSVHGAPAVVGLYRRSVVGLAGLAGLLALSAPFVSSLYHLPEMTSLLRILSLGGFCSGILLLHSGLLRSRMQVVSDYTIQALQQTVFLLLLLALPLFGDRLQAFAWFYSVSMLLGAVLSTFILRRVLSGLGVLDDSSAPKPSGMYGFAATQSLTQLLGRFQGDFILFVLAMSLAPSQLALYRVALVVGLLPGLFLQALNNIFAPLAGQLVASRDLSTLRSLHAKASAVLFCCWASLFVCFLLWGRQLLGIFGDDYRIAYLPLLIIAASEAVDLGVGPSGYVVLMMGRASLLLLNTVVLLALLIWLTLALAPTLGVLGGAIAYAVSNVLTNLLRLAEALWLYRHPPQEHIVPASLASPESRPGV
ncbi:hypothetical protein COY28_04455 [Candidatus Woesearchaeota archaeon CG_4_10_14_0_2_um_filter_57_5]|nr:MAG: hypothetical protein AUJ68_07215 [Candidatus Woesearchaeota archaeon CG1_02_57_44]PIN67502.1 MAG: hypothetical protein COV94_07215 [Candidatus Woesearchaeota archaeon CG11_big_fil_rev_8_21_14_0_20_57_5]PIZ52560.1 MAG: hypothetical protein COY28_04455 [Candidatus Woesearchaeota archaeon CG_4_10_14_0_2_um_filter_57_5]